MRGISTCIVLALIIAVATAEVGRLVNRRSNLLNTLEEMAVAGRRYQLKIQKKWINMNRTFYTIFPTGKNTRKCAVSKFQKEWMDMKRTFLVPIPSGRNKMKCVIRRSCRSLTRPSSCSFSSPRSLPQRESASSSFTGSKISSTTVNRLFK